MIGLDDLFSRLETALEAGGVAWWETEFPSGVIFFSDLKAEMIGYRPTDFTHYGQFVDKIHPDDRIRVDEAMRDHLDGKTSAYEAYYRIKHKAGDYLGLYERGKVSYTKGSVTKLSGVVFDSNRKSTLS